MTRRLDTKPASYKKLSRAEKKWAYDHAKAHAVEMFRDLLTDEHHSIITNHHSVVTKRDGTVSGSGTEIHEAVMWHLERWFATVRKEKLRNVDITPASSRCTCPKGTYDVTGYHLANCSDADNTIIRHRRRKPKRRKNPPLPRRDGAPDWD